MHMSHAMLKYTLFFRFMKFSSRFFQPNIIYRWKALELYFTTRTVVLMYVMDANLYDSQIACLNVIGTYFAYFPQSVKDLFSGLVAFRVTWLM